MSNYEVDKFMDTHSLVSLSDNDEDSVINTIESVNGNLNKKGTNKDTIKKLDAGYNVYYIIKNKIKIRIEMYSTSANVGTLIRCPFTGIRSNDKVGSANENYYFKARMPSKGKGDVPITLYYTTPDSFERHHFINIPQQVKNEWYEKNNIMVPQQKYQETIETYYTF